MKKSNVRDMFKVPQMKKKLRKKVFGSLNPIGKNFFRKLLKK